MSSSKSLDYDAMFTGLVTRCNELVQQRNDIDGEVTKLKQLILATFPLLPAEKQAIYQKEIDQLEEESGGLLNAIKLVFSAHKGKWLTPSDVRDHLKDMGFDLTQYRANPLASIGTTLRRMVRSTGSHVISQNLPDGQVVYQRRLTLLDQMGRIEVNPDLLPEDIRGSLYGPRQGNSRATRLGYPNPTNTQKGKK
jgi:hypothetical protein